MPMEKDAEDLLKKIVKTLSMAVLWLLVNMTAGIYLGWMFYGDMPTIGNIVFYLFFVLSLSGLIWYFYKIWKKDIQDF